MHNIIDGFNNRISFNYLPLTTGSPFYFKSGGSYPVISIQPPLYTVSSVSVPDGVGGFSTANYTYERALFHKQGKGFLGFDKIIAENETTQIKTENYYELKHATDYYGNEKYCFMAPCTTKVHRGGSSILELYYATNIIECGNKIIFSYIGEKITRDILQSTKERITFENPDNYGNFQKIHTYYGYNTGNPVVEEVDDYT
ncbi:MAG: hypothetical protein HY738_21545 [Bacteroidia bacterium]|nr:hypothetical protein [Bacteroidia bacterium]